MALPIDAGLEAGLEANLWRGRGADARLRYLELCRLFGVAPSVRFGPNRERIICRSRSSPTKFWAADEDGWLVLLALG